tara:strand:+ start:474 stop:2225 length:1752 start_codon:yes stop_codon:yes gene_type:complete
MEKSFRIGSTNFSEGYSDDARNLNPATLAPPSKNCRLTLGGERFSRMGYEDTLYNLAQAGKTARCHHMPQFNVTFFTLNGKCYYVEHDRGDAVVDTGLSLTATETTRMADYAGDLYLINPTDGLRQIHVMRINDAAPDSGDATFTVDQDGGGRLNAFSDTSGNVRIRGTDETYSGVTTAGVFTITGNLTATYADNDICITVEDISSGKPKGTKIVFWKERMIIIGVASDTSVDNSAAIAYMSQFASGRDLQKIIVFGITGGASEEWVGKAGKLTNIIATRDYLYMFKEDETYYCAVSDVNTTTGATLPQLLSKNYGCVNEDCAVDMGSGLIAFLTKNKRIIGIRISSESGAAVVFPDEKFDQPIRNTLELLDADQSKARMVYHVGKRLLYVQFSVQNNILTAVNDNNIGKWLPPDDQKTFNDFYEKDGILHATDLYDDTVYEMDRGTTDNDQDIECVMAHGEFDQDMTTCEWKDVELSGSLAQNGSILVETVVNGGTSTGKTIESSSLSYTGARAIGDIVIGDMTLGGANSEVLLAQWAAKKRIAPTSYGQRYQTILSSTSPFSWQSYAVNGASLSSTLLTTA